MPRWLKITIRIIGIFLALVLILWLVVASYVYSNKKELLGKITTQLNENLNGTLTIESMEPELIRGFPGISVSLKKVLLRDSLWAIHKHDLLRASDIYIAVDVFSIIGGEPQIKNVSVQNGQIYLFTDTNGLSSIGLLKKNRKKENDNGRKRINRVVLENVKFVFDNQQKHKLYSFDIDRLRANFKYNSKGWNGTLDLKTRVNSLAFNISKGSFIKNKYLSTSLEMSFNESDRKFSVPMQAMSLDSDEINIGGDFVFAPRMSDFILKVSIPKILYKNAVSFLSPNIAHALKDYDLEKPMELGATIKGKLKNGGDPIVNAWWKVENNNLTARKEQIRNSSFEGAFTNRVDMKKDLNDPNSAVSFYRMKGIYRGIPFKSDSVRIIDLKDPSISGRFTADFPVSKLNAALGSESFQFNQGNARLNLFYKAPFNQNDDGPHYINGTIRISNAGLTYRPRGLEVKNLNVNLLFKNQDLFVRNANFKSGTTAIAMDGSLRNFLNFYYTDPRKIFLDWNVYSPSVNMNEFMGFLARKKIETKKSRSVSRISRQLDKMLDEADVHMKLKFDRMAYKRFIASQVISDITLKQTGIVLRNVSLKHGDGSLNIKGNLDQSGRINRFDLKSNINNVSIQKLFYAFNNFGQDAITDQNLRGAFFANTNVTGLMHDDGRIVPGSFHGTVNFNLKKGAIINFDPMERVGAFAFPNRNFSNITFNNLSNTLELQGNKVIIRPMKIESSVLNVFMEGVYGFTSGTNIALQIPLRNPKKDAYVLDDTLKDKRSRKGIIIFIKAVDGDDGKVKFKLGKTDKEKVK